MKKRLAVLLCLALGLALSFALAEEALQTITSGDFDYIVLEDGTAQIVNYHGETQTLEIPAELDGLRVTGIGDEAFYYCANLTGVSIPDSITGIGSRAFCGCSGLTDVTIPDSVTDLGDNPFMDCSALQTIAVSADHPTLQTIDGVLFGKADKRLICYPRAFTSETYAIPQGTETIGGDAFSYCESLTSVTFPASLTAIGENAFHYGYSLTNVVIPGNVTAISKGMFSLCSNLASITIPDSVTTIGDEAFYYCGLTEVTIPDSVTAIGSDAFSGCANLTAVAIPGSVTTIGDEAFSACSDELTITVERDSYAAEYCTENSLAYTYPDAND